MERKVQRFSVKEKLSGTAVADLLINLIYLCSSMLGMDTHGSTDSS